MLPKKRNGHMKDCHPALSYPRACCILTNAWKLYASPRKASQARKEKVNTNSNIEFEKDRCFRGLRASLFYFLSPPGHIAASLQNTTASHSN